MFEIVMRKQHNTLGFTIRKEDESPLGYYVRSIKCEPALSDGRIRVGDRLHSVNGVPLAPLPYEQAILFIRSVSETVWLRLYRGHPPPLLTLPSSPSSPTALLRQQPCYDRRSTATVIDHRHRTLRTGNRKQRSASFSETGAAPKRQLPQSGDTVRSRLLVRCNTEQNLVATNEEEDERLLVVPSSSSSSPSHPLSVALSLLPSTDVSYEIITVELQKGWNSRYGFSLRTEPDPVRTVISEIHPGSLAARDGRLRVGDVLLMINNESLGTRSTAQLIELLRILSGATIITVLRHPPSVPLPPSTVTEVPLQQHEQHRQPDGSCSLSFLHENGGVGWAQHSTKQEALLVHPSSTR
ncbi:inaD-like protein [Anopheles aquasalis]|uniref:inaD-like protein n=1 Tax=Anopheles aquasalis TaxID=42839 RepID=UPI00215AE5A5|nr:inaD-like protein [Anopheles aquasalis]